jgi:uncharacterized membrane protein YuzA (DUF378 family)
MKHAQLLGMTSLILLLIGGLNLGLMGLFGFNLIGAILGGFLSRLLFIVMGVASGFLIYGKFVTKEVTL